MLVRRTWFPSTGGDRESQVANISPTAAYYSLRLRDDVIGFASLTLDTSTTTVDVTEQIDLRLPDGDSLLRIVQRTRTTFDRQLGFEGVVVSRSQTGERTETRATRLSDTALIWSSGPEGRPARPDTTIAARGTGAPASALPLLVVSLRRPVRGAIRKVNLVDPLRRTFQQVEVAVLADSTFVVPDSAAVDSASGQWKPARYDTLHAWRITIRDAGPPLTLWIDENGLPVGGELLPGLVLERQPFELATATYRARFAPGSLPVARTPGSTALRVSPPPVGLMRVLLAATARDTIGWMRADLSGGYQAFHFDSLSIGAEPVGADRAGIDGARQALVPGRDRAMATMAQRIAAGATDQRQLAERLLAWVATEIAPAAESPFPGARHALRTRAGDASDRALLFCALAQAAGLEARPVAGLVAQEHGWARHAWAEVRLGDWVPVDPTFGTFPAGAGHARLLSGAPADPLYLTPLAALLAPERLTRQKTR